MDDKKLVTAIFIGRSGCGKGTQADLLLEYLKAKEPEIPTLYIETGQKFREFIQGDSLSSRRSRELMERDELQPSFLATYMWSSELIEKLSDNDHLIIDGSPRKLSEAKNLASALSFYGRIKPLVFHLNVSRDWSRERLLRRGRADDSRLSKIEKRLDWFEAEVVPTIEFFHRDDRFSLQDIDGERSITDIHTDIISRL